MKYLFVIFCFLLFIFACQSDLSEDVNNNVDTRGKAVYGKAVYGESEYGEVK